MLNAVIGVLSFFAYGVNLGRVSVATFSATCELLIRAYLCWTSDFSYDEVEVQNGASRIHIRRGKTNVSRERLAQFTVTLDSAEHSRPKLYDRRETDRLFGANLVIAYDEFRFISGEFRVNTCVCR